MPPSDRAAQLYPQVPDSLFVAFYDSQARLCGLVVRVPGYRSRGPEFDSRRYHIFWEVVDLERGPLSLVSITEELFERNSSGYGLEEYGRGDPLRWPRKLALTSPKSGDRTVGIVRLRTKATEFVRFSFLQLTGLRWRYSNQPSYRIWGSSQWWQFRLTFCVMIPSSLVGERQM
jgi:hypothetical protein